MTSQETHVNRATISRVVGAVAIFSEVLGDLSGDKQMPMQQLRLLLALYIHGELLQTDLVRHTGTQSSAVSRNLAKLGGTQKQIAAGESLGLLSHEPSEEDRRFHVARLTQKGRQVIEAAAAKAAMFVPT